MVKKAIIFTSLSLAITVLSLVLTNASDRSNSAELQARTEQVDALPSTTTVGSTTALEDVFGVPDLQNMDEEEQQHFIFCQVLAGVLIEEMDVPLEALRQIADYDDDSLEMTTLAFTQAQSRFDIYLRSTLENLASCEEKYPRMFLTIFTTSIRAVDVCADAYLNLISSAEIEECTRIFMSGILDLKIYIDRSNEYHATYGPFTTPQN
jgi:hypothetical protein